MPKRYDLAYPAGEFQSEGGQQGGKYMSEDEQIISIFQARKMLEMNKANFVDLLNDDSVNRLITSYEDEVREHIAQFDYK